MKSVNGLLSSHDLQSLVLNKKRQFCDEMGCEGGFEKTKKKITERSSFRRTTKPRRRELPYRSSFCVAVWTVARIQVTVFLLFDAGRARLANMSTPNNGQKNESHYRVEGGGIERSSNINAIHTHTHTLHTNHQQLSSQFIYNATFSLSLCLASSSLGIKQLGPAHRSARQTAFCNRRGRKFILYVLSSAPFESRSSLNIIFDRFRRLKSNGLGLWSFSEGFFNVFLFLMAVIK